MDPKDKNVNIELLRVVAAFGIIWFHTEAAYGRRFGYVGLPLFLLIFISLSVARRRVHVFKDFLVKRIRRLLIPWLFWSVIFSGLKLVNTIRLGQLSLDHIDARYLLIGSHIHLWYLPFAFMLSMIVYILNQAMRKLHNYVVISVSIIVGGLLLFICSCVMSKLELPAPFAQWIFGLPALPLGFSIGRACSLSDSRLKHLFLIVTVIVSLIVCLLLRTLGYQYLIIQYSIAIVLICGGYLYPSNRSQLILRMGSLTYGIYLIHPLVDVLLRKLSVLEYHFWFEITLTFVISLAATAVIKRTVLKQFV